MKLKIVNFIYFEIFLHKQYWLMYVSHGSTTLTPVSVVQHSFSSIVSALELKLW